MRMLHLDTSWKNRLPDVRKTLRRAPAWHSLRAAGRITRARLDHEELDRGYTGQIARRIEQK